MKCVDGKVVVHKRFCFCSCIYDLGLRNQRMHRMSWMEGEVQQT